MKLKVLIAVFKRNFAAYFVNPTGYLFICLFVLLSMIAAFWLDNFYNANLANLDQLTKWFPFVMLFFVPTITMGVWAEERRQGTDELLLTMPASDFEIVLGKYLACVGIYTISLLFSMCCSLVVLTSLGSPDVGLFLGTYFGYWLVGVAMLAIGMVASFVTANVTIAYVVGAVFSAPLVFLVYASAILPRELAFSMKQWSIGEQLGDFSHGVVSFAGIAYFMAIVATMLYLCMILIGRRHWVKGQEGLVMGSHFAMRTVALILIAAAVIVFFKRHDWRADVTSERLGSLSPWTKSLLADLDIEQPVQIEAFISREVPENYVQTRANLLNVLKELKSRGGGKVQLRVNDTEPYKAEAARAKQRYGIESRQVIAQNRGRMSREAVFMGVAFTSGLEKVIIPFVDRGIPVEYEMVRSIATVTQQKRRKVGILRTDAQLSGQFGARSWPIIAELRKQYDVDEVDPTQPIADDYDVLLAVQPSSLGPQEMNNFIDAVRRGVPTAIFEDPYPYFAQSVPATSRGRRQPGGMQAMMMGQQPPPKGQIGPLWGLLGVTFTESSIVWQRYDPLRTGGELPPEFVFVDTSFPDEEPFSESSPISSGIQYVVFPFPGAIDHQIEARQTKFAPLIRTGAPAGTVALDQLFMPSHPMFGGGDQPNPDPDRGESSGASYVVAAHITGIEPADAKAAPDNPFSSKDGPGGDPGERGDEGDAGDTDGSSPKPRRLNVVLVADIDMLHEAFFQLREQGRMADSTANLDFDNVTFVLNVLDQLAGDERFIEIRKRRPRHRTLSWFDEKTEEARSEMDEKLAKLRKASKESMEEESRKLREKIEALSTRYREEGLSREETGIRAAMAMKEGQERIQAQTEKLDEEYKAEEDAIKANAALDRQAKEGRVKMWAVLLPPVLPLMIGIVVWGLRRKDERLGVEQSRLR